MTVGWLWGKVVMAVATFYLKPPYESRVYKRVQGIVNRCP